MDIATAFKTLGLEPGASLEEIERNYQEAQKPLEVESEAHTELTDAYMTLFPLPSVSRSGVTVEEWRREKAKGKLLDYIRDHPGCPKSRIPGLRRFRPYGPAPEALELLKEMEAEGWVVNRGHPPRHAWYHREEDPGKDVLTGPRGGVTDGARRLARRSGIAVRELEGSGPGGRVYVEDVKAVQAEVEEFDHLAARLKHVLSDVRNAETEEEEAEAIRQARWYGELLYIAGARILHHPAVSTETKTRTRKRMREMGVAEEVEWWDELFGDGVESDPVTQS